jgi:hypothetical protein
MLQGASVDFHAAASKQEVRELACMLQDSTRKLKHGLVLHVGC